MQETTSNHTVLAEKNGIQIVEDHDKGYIHVSPLPDPEKLVQLYEDEYFQIDKKEYFEKAKRDEDWNNLNFQDKYDFFEQQMGRKGSVLDVGCGSGHFLRYGKKIGWKTKGIEPSPVACQFSNQELGLDVINGFYDDKATAQLGQFDVVHLRNVLEHLPNPIETLQLCHNNLNPGGIICVSVPNDFSPFQKIAVDQLGVKDWWIVPDHHLNYFNPQSLATVIEKAGFEVIYKESSFPLDMFLVMGDNYIGNGEVGKVSHQKRKNFDLRLSQFDNQLRRKLYAFFAEQNIGRECILYAVKP